MFYLAAIPDILHSEDLNAVSIGTKKETHTRMTVDKSVNQQETGIAPDEAASLNEAALLKLYEQFRRPIHTYTYRLLGNREDADDVTQEVFVRACLSWEGLYEREHLSAWLYRIATNLCVDALRRRKRISWWPLSRRTHRDESPDEMGDDIANWLADSGGIPEVAERDFIRQVLESMPQDYAIALVLSAAQGVPYQRIAEITGITPNAAATRISRAKKIFAEKYQYLVRDGVSSSEK